MKQNVSELDKFKPEIILISAGFDAHKNDNISSIKLESKDYYTITKDIRVNITWFLEFTELPETARRYITIRAARIFQDRMLASETLHAFHQVDELSALSALKEHEGDTRDHSIFDNYSTYRVIDRDNFQPAKTTISDE